MGPYERGRPDSTLFVAAARSRGKFLTRPTYSRPVAKAASLNLDESIDHVVGRRTATLDGLSTATSRTADSIAWRNALGGVRVPHGVYRFTTHDEADRWQWRTIARPTR